MKTDTEKTVDEQTFVTSKQKQLCSTNKKKQVMQRTNQN